MLITKSYLPDLTSIIMDLTFTKCSETAGIHWTCLFCLGVLQKLHYRFLWIVSRNQRADFTLFDLEHVILICLENICETWTFACVLTCFLWERENKLRRGRGVSHLKMLLSSSTVKTQTQIQVNLRGYMTPCFESFHLGQFPCLWVVIYNVDCVCREFVEKMKVFTQFQTSAELERLQEGLLSESLSVYLSALLGGSLPSCLFSQLSYSASMA